MRTKLRRYLSLVLCMLILMGSNVFPQVVSADGQVAAPVLSPLGGTYTSAQAVSMTCSTSGATIRYTTDGSDPSLSSPVYSIPITVSTTTTVKAYATAAGMTDSAIASATYTIGAASPTISPETATFYMANQADIPVTMTLNSTTLSAIKCGASALTTSDYSVSGNVATLRKGYFNYFFGKFHQNCTLTFVFGDSSTKAFVVTPVYPDSAVSPSAVTFDTSAQADIPVTLTLNGNTLTSIEDGTRTLVLNTDYTLSGSAVTLKTVYLSKLQANTTLRFKFNGGNPQTLTVNVISNLSPAISPETATFYMTNQADIPVTMTLNSTTLSAIKCGASALTTSDYSISGNVATLRKGYFNYFFGRFRQNCTLTFVFGDSSTKAFVVAPVYPDSAVSPSAVTFNKSVLADIPVTLTLNGNSLTSIEDGTRTLLLNSDYTQSGSAVTLKTVYLSKLQANTTLRFKFNGGNPQTLTVNVISNLSPAISPTTATFDKGNPADISVALTLNGNTLTSISNGTTPLNSVSDYTLSGSAVILKSGYFSNKSSSVQLTFAFSNGSSQMLTVAINEVAQLITPSTLQHDMNKPDNSTVTIQAGETLTSIKAGNSSLTKGTDYTVSGNVVTLKGYLNYIFGKWPSVTCNLTFFMASGKSAVLSATKMPDSITPSAIQFDMGNPADLSITVQGQTLSDIKAGTASLPKDKYTTSSGIAVISKDYFTTYFTSAHQDCSLTFVFNGGGSKTLTVSPIYHDSWIALSAVTFDKSAPADIPVNLTLGIGSTLTSIRSMSRTLIQGTDYTISGNTVTIKASYLNSLPSGDTVLIFEFSTGSPKTLTISSKNEAQAPTAPGNLTCTTKTAVSALLSWTQSTDNIGVTEYDIYNGTTLIGTTKSTEYKVIGLSSNTTYNFIVKAKDAEGNSSSSTAQVVTLIDTPKSLKSTLSNGNAVITWDAVNGATGYEVYRNNVKVSDVNTASFTDPGIPANTSWIYKVKAYNGTENFSEESSPVGASTGQAMHIIQGMQLTEDTVYSDLYFDSNVQLDLNGHKLTVTGKLVQTQGILFINSGRLEVLGDYIIQSKDQNGNDCNSDGLLEMIRQNDYVYVGGSFITQSQYMYFSDYLKNGTLEVKGDFRQVDNGYHFEASGEHRVVLSGESDQIVNVGPNCMFNILEIRNKYAQFSFPNVIKANKLIANECAISSISLGGLYSIGSDIVIDGSFKWNRNGTVDLDLEGKTLTVKGNAILDAPMELSGGTLNVEGDLNQTYGYMYVDCGRINVLGDYRLQGTLSMVNPEDYVYVGGNFITHSTDDNGRYLQQGVLEVKGDFEHENFNPKDNHTVKLSGSGLQKVTFSISGSFQNLIITKPIATGYIFSHIPAWVNLIYSDPSLDKIPMHFGTGGPYAPTGNYSRTFTDMSAAAPGFNTAFTRTYNSRNENAATSLFGRGWSFGYEGSTKAYSDTLQVVTLPDGSILTFNNSNGTFTANDSRNTLVKNSDGTYTLSTKDLHTYTFNSAGYMTQTSDRYGNNVKINVDSNGKFTSVKDSAGRTYDIVYTSDNTGHISTITENNTQRKVIYGYDDNHRLSSITDPAGNITTYTYDGSDYLSGIYNGVNGSGGKCIETIVYNHTTEGPNNGKINTITDSYGNVKTYNYDNTMGRTIITDSSSKKTTQWYDSQYSITTNEDAGGRSTSVQYETYGGTQNKYSEEKFVTDRNGNKTEYVRYDNGNIHYIINRADNSQKEFAYDDNNNITSEKDENGKYTFYVYDGNLLSKKAQPLKEGITQFDSAHPEDYAITTYIYKTFGNGSTGKQIQTITDPELNVTTYDYYDNGDLKTVNDPENPQNLITYSYNGFGCRKEVKTPKGYITTSTYDNDGRLEKQVISGGNETTRITYDQYGRKTKEVSPNLYDSTKDNIEGHTYDGDHGYRYTYFDSGKVETVKDPENNLTSYTYDLYGNLKTQTSQNNSIYRYEYDNLNRPRFKYFRENAASSEVLLEEYIYNILSDGKTQKTVRRYLDDTHTADTVYTYDYAGRQISQLNPDLKTVSINYNLNGTVNYSTSATGGTTYFAYDTLNRVKQKWVPFDNANGNTFTYVSYDYYKNNLVKTESDSKDVVAKDIVSTNLVTKDYIYYKNGKQHIVSDSAGRKTEYFYDADGNVNKEVVNADKDDQTKTLVTEYDSNYSEKPVVKKVHVRAGDLSGNSYTDNTDTILTTSYGYDKNGNLKTFTSPAIVVTTYSYDNMNRQTGVSQPGKDENGNNVTIATSTHYNWEGKPDETKDAKGNAVTYEYNQRGLLSKTIKHVTSNGAIIPLVDAYYYDRGGRRTAEVSPENYDDTKTITQMNRTVYEYDGMDRVIKKSYIGKTKTFDPAANKWNDKDDNIVLEAYDYDGNGNILGKQDALGVKGGYKTEYTYNLQNNVKTVLDPETKSRGLAFTARYDYDGLGRKTGETNAKQVTIINNYDDAGNVTSKVLKKNAQDAGTVFESSTYDLLGNALTRTSFNNANNTPVTTTYKYNAFGKVREAVHPGDETIPSETITYQYDVVGSLKNQVNDMGTAAVTADDVVDLYTYDNQGRALSHTQQKGDGTEGITTSVKYDVNGNKRFEIDGKQYVKENTYDEVNNLVTTKLEGKHLTLYGYNKDGKQVTETDWRGNVARNIYDALGRLIEKDDAFNKAVEKLEYNQNNVQVNSYDALNHLTQHQYDKNNRLLATIDPKNHTTSQTYDDAGNILTKTDGRTKTTQYDYDEFSRLKSVLNAKNETTSYTYDLSGNMLTQTDGKSHVTTFIYNAANKPKARMDNGVTQPTPGKSETYTYYSDGSLHTKTDRKGCTTTYAYDSHGRVTSTTAGALNITYGYDNNGNQTTIGDNVTGTVTRLFDELGRVTTKTVPNVGASGTITTSYLYDLTDGVEDGFIKETSTDQTSKVTTKVYDKAGRLKSVIVGSDTTTYNYYDNGSRASVVYNDNSREDYTYYDDNLLWTLTNKKADGSTIDAYTYEYDAAHNMSSKTDKYGTTLYGYDNLERLETVTEPAIRVTTYGYDAAGNREKETVVNGTNIKVTTYYYDDRNRLTSAAIVLNNVLIELDVYGNDNNGNVLTATVTTYPSGGNAIEKTTVNHYDEFNRLINTQTPDALVENVYNGEGLRVVKKVNGAVTKYIYEYNNVVQELDSAGNQTARNVYGTNLLMRTVGSQSLYYMYNGHGDVTALINAGAVVATYYYDAFGNLDQSKTTGNANNSITYAGYQYDKETGLYYLNARMYDPKIARFLQEDTYTGDPNDPLSLNLYTYCNNEPLMYSDPTGHYAFDIVEGFKTVFLKSKEERQEDFEAVYDYNAKNGDFITKSATIISGGAAGVGDMIKNPVQEFDNFNHDVVKPFVVDDLGVKEGSTAYKAMQYVGKKAEAVSVYSVNMVKGVAGVGAKAVETKCYEALNNVASAGYNFGMVDYDTYNQINSAYNADMEFWGSMPSNMINGLGNDVRTLIDPNKAYDFFMNPNASLQSNAEYMSAGINTATVVLPAAKGAMTFARAGAAGGKAFIAAMKEVPVRAFRVAETGEVVVSTASERFVNAVGKGAKEAISYIEKNGSGVSKANPEKVVNDLSDFKGKKWTFGNQNFMLDKSGMKHILERHSPKYWDGSVKTTQTFLDSSLSIDDITNISDKVLKQNRSTLIQKGTTGMYQVEGTVNGIDYVVGLNKGRVGQLYKK